MDTRPLPSSSLVVLIGPPASGKSTWAADNFRPDQIVSSDQLRGVVGEHPLDMAATDDAMDLLLRIVEQRAGRKLTTVIDTTGLDAEWRQRYLDIAKAKKLTAIAVRFATTAAECKRRNRERAHPVPARVIDTMAKAARGLDLNDELWDLVIEPEAVRTVTPKLAPQQKPSLERDLVDSSAEGTRSQPDGERASEQRGQLRFGLHIPSFDWVDEPHEVGPTLARVAEEAEAAGFDSLWVMDHMIQIPQLGSEWDPMLESYATLSYLAAATERIRLGVLVSAVTFRNVGHLAKTIATLDVLSGGRAIAGLGAGNHQREHEAYGWEFPAAPDRLALLAETLQALPLFWGPGAPSFDGEVISVAEAVGYPRPIQDPIPIIVGGSGERVTLRLAAQYGNGCNVFGDVATVARKIEVLQQHCRDVGRDPAEVETTHLGTVLVGADREDLRERVDRLRPPRQGPDRFAAASNAGTIDDHEARFRAMAAAGLDTAIMSTPDLTHPTTFHVLGELIRRFGSSPS